MTSPKACVEGKERNPETNRCRKVSSGIGLSGDDLPLVTDIALSTSGGTVNWVTIAVTLLITVSYMLYEWLVKFSRKLRYLSARIQLR